MLCIILCREMANHGSTKIFVDKSLWHNTTDRLKGRTAEALSVNTSLEKFKIIANSAIIKQITITHYLTNRNT